MLTEREQLLADSEEVDEDSPWVFPGKGAFGHIVDPGNTWESLRQELGISDLWIHDLRRSLASTMANTGADVSVVRAALNHTDMRTTLKAYIRTSQQVQLQARQKAQEAWLEAMRRQPANEESISQESENGRGKPAKGRSKVKPKTVGQGTICRAKILVDMPTRISGE